MPEPAQVAVTDAEIDAALGRARKYAKYDRRVLNATYSKATDRLRLVLDDGAIYTIPRRLIQGLAGAQEKELNRIQMLGGGTGLLWPFLDVAHYVPGLLQGVYGSEKWMTGLYKQRRNLRLVETTHSQKRK
jgi:predicted TPR repeat methyltransferase